MSVYFGGFKFRFEFLQFNCKFFPFLVLFKELKLWIMNTHTEFGLNHYEDAPYGFIIFFLILKTSTSGK